MRLFHRTRRNVQLTDAGRVVLEEARRTLAQAGEVIRAAERARRGQAGHLRIGFSSSAPYTMLPAILRTFRERFPDVALTLLERSSEEQAHLLFERVSDAGFVRPPIEDSAGLLIVRAILREPLVAALPDSHPLGRARTVAVKSLARNPSCCSRAMLRRASTIRSSACAGGRASIRMSRRRRFRCRLS